jgi:hypothetical protein
MDWYNLQMSCGRRRRLLAFFLAASAVTVSCGDDPPQFEIQQAQSAIDAARTSGADQYAPDELAEAEGALARARTAVDQRDYRLALNHSIDSRERAQTAAREAAAQKAAARTEAERALEAASAALAEASARVKAAPTGGAAARRLAAARRTLAAAERAVQEARAAFDRGNFKDVASTLTEPMANLSATSRDLDAAPRATSRRRR